MVLFVAIIIGGLAAVLWGILQLLLQSAQDASEPPVLLSSIPFISPAISLLLRRSKLCTHLFHQYGLPIYTLRLLWMRLYVINGTSLVSMLQRHPKVISFAAIEAAAMTNLLGLSEETKCTLNKNPSGEDGHFVTFHSYFRPVMSPGPDLNSMCQRLVRTLGNSLDLSVQGGESGFVNLFQWIQHKVILATTDAEYGPGNPFRQPAFEKAWYTWEKAVPLISAGIFPRIIARNGIKAREHLFNGFKSYFERGHHHGASPAFHARLGHSIDTGFTKDDIYRGEAGALLASLNNVGPAAFWMLYHIFSDPVVLAECRAEMRQDAYLGRAMENFDLSDFKNSCPVLTSTFQEVLRYRGVGTLVIRQVLEDHMLDNQYLLKKGGIVLIPNVVQHFRQDIWGHDAGTFQHRRFLDPKTGKLKRTTSAAFQPFGAGSTLCLGRHMAQVEILAAVAFVIANLDIEPVLGSWDQVTTQQSFGLGVARIFVLPDKDIKVRLCPKEKPSWGLDRPVEKEVGSSEDVAGHIKKVQIEASKA
ncbi:cytochrome P450 oxidoreductase [Thozetella sp. PMI_491]|nr:cytochrome P450 oxidoreductase [Thozetella sp. PMI_491]